MLAKQKKIKRIAIVHLPAGQAKPGTALASYEINMAEFTRQFNEQTKDKMGDLIPVEITSYSDKSFSFKIKTSPVSFLLKKALKIAKAGKNQLTDKVGKISKEKALEIAKYKLPDLSAYDEETALKIIAGTAKQMGIEIDGVDCSHKQKEGSK